MTVIGGLSPDSAILNDCGISRFSPSTQNVAPPSIVIFALFIFKNLIRFDEYSFENPTKNALKYGKKSSISPRSLSCFGAAIVKRYIPPVFL